MIKTTVKLSAHSIHLLHLIVRRFFIAIVLLLFAFFFWLIHGIEIDKLDIGRYRIDGLYIKLDKKLTLKAKEIILPQTKASPSFGRVEKTFDEIKYLLRFFDRIMLEKVDFSNNHYAVFYGDDVLYISNDIYEIAGNIERHGNRLVADIPILFIKKLHAVASGKLTYDLEKEKLETGGSFEIDGIKGHFRAVQNDNAVLFALNTERTGRIRSLIKRFHITPAIESWIIDKVKAKHYKLAYLKGRLFIHGQKVKMDVGSLKGKVLLDDVDIRFHKKLPPSHASRVAVNFHKGNLSFDLMKPHYLDRDLSGTSVIIKHLIGTQSPVLKVDIHTVSPFDKRVTELLHAYGLNIPLTHTGKSRTQVLLTIPLKRDKKIKTYVRVKPGEGMLKISGFPLHIKGGEILYRNGQAKLSHINVHESWYQGEVNGVVSTDLHKADLLLDASRIALGDRRNPFLDAEKLTIPLKLSYKDTLSIQLPTLQTEIYQKNHHLRVDIADISRIIPMLNRNLLGINGGHVTIRSDDMKQIVFQGEFTKNSCFFYDKNGVCYTRIPMRGSIILEKNILTLQAFNGHLKANIPKHRIGINAIHIDIKRLLDEMKRVNKRSGKRAGKLFDEKSMIITGKNSHLRYGPYRLVTDSYDIEIFPNSDIKAIGSVDGDIVKFSRKKEYFSLQALRVKDTMLHPLIRFTGLKHGRYSLKMKGDPDKVMKGKIIIEGGILSDFKAYSNTLAFINTVPALATFSNPGFSDKGFRIKEGVIKYTMTPKKIVFDSIYLKGNSATVAGKGEVDIQTKQVDVKLAIMTVRELGKVLGSIPMLGYILMGDDHSMTVGLEVKGTLSDPKVSTTVAKDILTLPMEIIKRTVTAPVHMYNNQKRVKKKLDTPRLERNGSRTKIPVPHPKPIRSSTPSTDRSGQLF